MLTIVGMETGMDGVTDEIELDFGKIAQELGLRTEQVAGVTALLDEGNTVPFITRYRKERTGNLDEEQIRQIQSRVESLRQLNDRAKRSFA